MPRNFVRILAAVTLLAISGPALAKKGKGGKDDKGGNDRKAWVKKFDHNNDGDWRGGLFGHKDIRKFKKAHPGQYEKLVKFCDKASGNPKKHDVKIPKGVKEKKVKCKKGKVDGPYLKAWVKAGKPEKDTPTRGPGDAVRK